MWYDSSPVLSSFSTSVSLGVCLFLSPTFSVGERDICIIKRMCDCSAHYLLNHAKRYHDEFVWNKWKTAWKWQENLRQLDEFLFGRNKLASKRSELDWFVWNGISAFNEIIYLSFSTSFIINQFRVTFFFLIHHSVRYTFGCALCRVVFNSNGWKFQQIINLIVQILNWSFSSFSPKIASPRNFDRCHSNTFHDRADGKFVEINHVKLFTGNMLTSFEQTKKKELPTLL